MSKSEMTHAKLRGKIVEAIELSDAPALMTYEVLAGIIKYVEMQVELNYLQAKEDLRNMPIQRRHLRKQGTKKEKFENENP